MNSINEKTARNLYSIILIAGIAVTVFSLFSIAAITDFLPQTKPKTHSESALDAKQLQPEEVSEDRCTQCGRIILMQSIETPENPTGLGTVTRGVTGAVVGNEIEKKTRARLTYEVTMRMDDGSNRKVHQAYRPVADVGELVKIVNGHITTIK